MTDIHAEVGARQNLLLESDDLRSICRVDELNRTSDTAWSHLKPTLEHIIENTSAKRVLEIGAGRYPFFSTEDVDRMEVDLTISDVDPNELEQADQRFARMVLNVSDQLYTSEHLGSFDLIFSKMVFEHVKDGQLGWQNVCKLLAPGGIGFAFVPTLYSPPFVLNRMLPDYVSSVMVRALDPRRNSDETPKFPAYYSHCRASEKSLRPMLIGAGFSEVCVVPFYGTPYVSVVKGFRRITRVFDHVVSTKDWRSLASYAYIIARK